MTPKWPRWPEMTGEAPKATCSPQTPGLSQPLGGIDTLAHLKSFFMELSWPCSCSFTSICSSSSLCSFFFELSSLSISSSASSTCRFIAFKRKLNCKGWGGWAESGEGQAVS